MYSIYLKRESVNLPAAVYSFKGAFPILKRTSAVWACCASAAVNTAPKTSVLWVSALSYIAILCSHSLTAGYYIHSRRRRSAWNSTRDLSSSVFLFLSIFGRFYYEWRGLFANHFRSGRLHAIFHELCVFDYITPNVEQNK